ncbi:MAG: hypothetical protein KJ601_04830 [Nanoarchaeota archaeon]|nr:hypothetical protein [Nanoarchaeota archaeon]MBU1703747.1 hypothetical protein [Nanoarchaeota archaeon]
MMLLICPKCRHKMKYGCRDGILKGKSKVCVYCGKSFSVLNNIVKQNV